jgi:hypothetical protein
MDLEKYYKKYNFPASSTLIKQLKNEGIKTTKKEIDEFINNRVEQQKTVINNERKKTLGKIVAYRPLSLIQMDIYIMAKYVKGNKGYKYILCMIDVFTRKVWAYKMKKKDNKNVQDSFKQFISDSNIKEFTPTILMSDNDGTFINKSFQEILEKNQIIHQPNILDDHHALGLIDRFARTLKMILTRLFLQKKSTNWINYLDEIIKNYNNNGHSAIDYIAPNEVFFEPYGSISKKSPSTLKKNFEKIYNINYEKSLFNISISDIDVNDKVRIKIKGQFRKGTEARYTDEVYTVKKVRGNAVTLDNDEVYKRSSLLIVPKTTVSDEQNVIVKVNKQNKINRNIDKEGLDVVNIVLDKRKRNKLLNTLDNNVEVPKNLRRSTRISSQEPKVSKKTSQLPRAVAVPSVLGIDLDDLPGEVPVMRRDIYGRPLPQW